MSGLPFDIAIVEWSRSDNLEMSQLVLQQIFKRDSLFFLALIAYSRTAYGVHRDNGDCTSVLR